jgi:membrane-associated protein
MTLLTGLHGTIAVVLFCALLFAEESGVPLPFAPGDGILIAAGVLIANGALAPWIFVPIACCAVLGGALTGYSWTRAIGSRGLYALAARLRATKMLDRVTDRLRSAGPAGIAVCRLLPGLRVYTSLVAGAAGVELRPFLLGTIPSIIVWVCGFTLLGALVGIPAQHFLGQAGKVALNAAMLAGVGLGGYFALRHIPAAERGNNALQRTPRPGRLALALALDVGIVASVVSGVTELIRDGGGPADPDGFTDIVLIVVVVALSYVVVSRRGVGGTGGEALLNITYRHKRGVTV